MTAQMRDNRPMSGQDNAESHGFEFPGHFEISAMGAAESGLERLVPDTLVAAGLSVVRESVRVRASSAGRYVSVRVSFLAESREHYDAAHAALRALPEVKWTI